MPVPRGRSIVAVTRKFHGLGNRARVVFGARALARSTDRLLYTVWPVTTAFGARLDQLWEVDIPTVPQWFSRAMSVRYPYRDETLSWTSDVGNQRVWQIRTAHALHLPGGASAWERELHAVRPVQRIADRVRRFHDDELRGHVWIGVMIRAHPHSHAETLAASPVEWYVRRLRALREEHGDVRFYISADTEQAQQEVMSAIPGCVGLTGKGAYNSVAGLRAAVADLYLLAASAHLIGPHFSSFPELATRLAGSNMIKLETSRTDESRRFQPASATAAPDPLRPHERVPLTQMGW